MTQPGSIGSLVPASSFEDAVAGELRALRRLVRELQTAQAQFFASQNFDGTLDPPTAGTQGWGFTAAGGFILNALVAKAGVVPNNALAAAVNVEVGNNSANTYSIPSGTGTTKTSVALAVPSGYTQLFFFAAVQDQGKNSTASTDWLNSMLTVTAGSTTVAASGSSPDCLAGAHTTSSALLAYNLTGLSGGSVTFASQPMTSAATWASAAGNSTAVSVLGVFAR